MVQLWKSGRIQGDYTINNPTTTAGPPRDLADPSTSVDVDAAEVIDPKRCLQPLQRAREHRGARLKEGGHTGAEFRDELLVDRDPKDRHF